MSCLKERKRRELHLDKRPDLFIVIQGLRKEPSAPRGGSPDRRGRFGGPSLLPFLRLIDILVGTQSSVVQKGRRSLRPIRVSSDTHHSTHIRGILGFVKYQEHQRCRGLATGILSVFCCKLRIIHSRWGLHRAGENPLQHKQWGQSLIRSSLSRGRSGQTRHVVRRGRVCTIL